jgi:hypothetical protein
MAFSIGNGLNLHAHYRPSESHPGTRSHRSKFRPAPRPLPRAVGEDVEHLFEGRLFPKIREKRIHGQKPPGGSGGGNTEEVHEEGRRVSWLAGRRVHRRAGERGVGEPAVRAELLDRGFRPRHRGISPVVGAHRAAGRGKADERARMIRVSRQRRFEHRRRAGGVAFGETHVAESVVGIARRFVGEQVPARRLELAIERRPRPGGITDGEPDESAQRVESACGEPRVAGRAGSAM